ncbi:Hypothetical protein POVN_LOCUS648 [uncultured virus]|nr:Hypothetical protein POVN_LOCUS648 [uncultured virus]
MFLVESDARRGIAGKVAEQAIGGRAGRGGSGGSGGSGGAGGSSYSWTTYTTHRDSKGHSHRTPHFHHNSGGSRGPSGDDGHAGRSGKAGAHGRLGNPAPDGKEGSVTWVLTDDDGKEIERSSIDRFAVAVSSFELVDENQDGIFEPGTEVWIQNTKWRNHGDLTLPEGCSLQYLATSPSLTALPLVESLPEVKKMGEEVSPTRFRLTIDDIKFPSAQAPHQTLVSLTSRVTLLGREFLDGSVATALNVQFPIKITNVECTSWLGPGERTQVKVIIENTAKLGYGVNHTELKGEMPLSFRDRRVEVHLRTDPRLIIETTAEDKSYHLDEEFTGVHVVNEIKAKEVLTITFWVLLAPEAISHLFEELKYSVSLCLRERTIETRSYALQVTPTYTPHLKADTVLITSGLFTRKEYLAWSLMFQLLQKSFHTWDVRRHNNSVRCTADVSWVGRCQTLIVPLSADVTTQMLRQNDILAHYKLSKDNAVLFLGAGDLNHLIYDLRASVEGGIGAPREREDVRLTGCFPCCHGPDNGDVLQAGVGKVTKHQAQHPETLCVGVLDYGFAGGCFGSYSLGEYGIFQAALPRSTRMVCLSGVGSLSQGNVPFTLTETEYKVGDTTTFSLNDTFTRVLITLLDLTPLKRRLGYLIDSPIKELKIVNSTATQPYTKALIFSLFDIITMGVCDEMKRAWEYQPTLELAPYLDAATSEIKGDPAVRELIAGVFISALEYRINLLFWKAFPWCCNKTNTKRDQMKAARKRLKTLLRPGEKEGILSTLKAKRELHACTLAPLFGMQRPFFEHPLPSTTISNADRVRILELVEEKHAGESKASAITDEKDVVAVITEFKIEKFILTVPGYEYKRGEARLLKDIRLLKKEEGAPPAYSPDVVIVLGAEETEVESYGRAPTFHEDVDVEVRG